MGEKLEKPEAPEAVFKRCRDWFETESARAVDEYLKELEDSKLEGASLASRRSGYAQKVGSLVKAVKRDFLIGYYQYVKATTELDLTPTVVGHALHRVMGRKIHFAELVRAFGRKGRSAKEKSSVGEKELEPYDREAQDWLEKLTREIEDIKEKTRSKTEAAAKASKKKKR